MNIHESTNTLRFGTPLAQSRSAVLLLHGRGSSADDIASLADSLPADGIAFVAPSATNGAWYPQRFFAPLEQNEPGLSNGLRTIDHLVNEILAAGIPAGRIGLIGFSQGGCLALEYAARKPRRYHFVAGLSSALIGPLDTSRVQFDLQGTPVLIGCAEHDAHIPLPYVENSAATLSTSGAVVTKQIYAGGTHSVFPQEITWLRERMNSSSEFLMTRAFSKPLDHVSAAQTDVGFPSARRL
jgi:phospholipase/carboxylesterase